MFWNSSCEKLNTINFVVVKTTHIRHSSYFFRALLSNAVLSTFTAFSAHDYSKLNYAYSDDRHLDALHPLLGIFYVMLYK